jgi:pimeloyl-ACP methyl ester carboxylesterase
VPTRPSWLHHLGRRALQALRYRSTWVETSVGPVHLLSRQGSGELPPVLLVHGFGDAALHWAPLVRALRPHVRSVLALDLPGHGFSHRPERLTLDTLRDGVIEALDRVHAEPAVVVGNSLGGAVALRYTQARPDRVLGTHLISPGGAPMTPEELVAVRELFAVKTWREALAFLDKLHAYPLGWRGHLLAPSVRRLFRDPALHSLLEQIRESDWLTPDEVRTLTRPVRLVWGKRDQILPSRALEFWRAHLPGHAEVEEPERFGHAPHFDAAHQTAEDILGFVRRCATKAG